jgi:hypothetical protein
MNTVRARRKRNVDSVVDEEQSRVLFAQAREAFGENNLLSIRPLLCTELDRGYTAIKGS